MLPLSVVIITKNEELNIEDALKSVSDAREIIVVDSFSDDKTVELCKKYTDKVYQHEWQGFARQKQLAVDYAEGPWVLVLDADERVTPELKSEIEQRLSGSGIDGFYIPRKNFFLGRWIRYCGWWPDKTLRLFKKDKGRFEIREVHEKIIVDGTVGSLDNVLEHYTYRSISDYVDRMQRYSTLAAKEILKNKGRAGLYSLTVRPFATFLKMYLLRLGFLEGMHGLVLSMLYCCYTFLKYAKTWERQS